MQRGLYGVTVMTLLSYGGEYMAFTSILAWLDLLLLNSGYSTTQAYGFGFLVSAAYLLLSGVLAIPLGFLADFFGRRNTAVAGCFLAGASILVVSLTGSIQGADLVIVSISILLLLVGIGHATYTVSALAYAGDISTEEDVGEAYGLVETAEYTMFMFGTPLGSVLAGAFGNQATFYITAAILAAGAFAGYFGMPESATQPSLAGTTPSIGSGRGIRGKLSVVAAAARDPKISTSLVAIFFVSVGFTVFRVYLTQYGFSGPYVVALMAAASVFAAVPIGQLVDTTKKRTLFMVLGFLVEGLALALIFYQPSAISLILWALVFGVAVMLVRVPQAVVIAERTVVENRASAMGANHGVEHIGYGVGAFIGGILLVVAGFTTFDTFLLVAAISAGFGVVLLLLSRALKMG